MLCIVNSCLATAVDRLDRYVSPGCPCMCAGKAHGALDHLYSGSESPGGWQIPAAAGQGVNGAAKMGRREAWARFLAYDVSLLCWDLPAGFLGCSWSNQCCSGTRAPAHCFVAVADHIEALRYHEPTF